MKRRHLITFGLIILTVVTAVQVQALTVNDLTVVLGCTSWSYYSYTFTLDRDNTGSGQEAFYIEARDGNGTLIHRYPSSGVVLLALGNYGEGGQTGVNYNVTNPAADPITYRWISVAGNALDEQIAYETVQNPGCGTPPPTDPPPTDPPPTDPSPTDPPPTVTATPTPSPFSTPAPEEGQFNPRDLRLNRSNKDRAAPVAIYCMAHGIQVRVINEGGRGIDPPAINLFFEEIEAAGIPSGNHLLLAEAQGIQLWRLTDGGFQVNTSYPDGSGKPYIVYWDSCPYSQVTTLAS